MTQRIFDLTADPYMAQHKRAPINSAVISGHPEMTSQHFQVPNRVEPVFSLEGGEGSGKTTIAQILQHLWSDFSIDLALTREPGGVDIAEKIRSIILDKSHTELTYEAEALLYAAARSQHLVQKIFPMIEAGKMILFDRYVDSSLAYQGFGRNLGVHEIYGINMFATRHFFTDMTFFIDVPPEIGFERLAKDSSREINRLDLETMEFHQMLYAGYHKLLKMYPDRICRIDGTRDKYIVARDIFEHMWEIRKEKYGIEGSKELIDETYK